MLSLIALALLCVNVAVGARVLVSEKSEVACASPSLLSTSFIGESGNVKLEHFGCADDFTTAAASGAKAKRQGGNVCGAACTTNCFNPGGGGPNADDCQVIADALLYDSQHSGPQFNITAFTNTTTNYLTLSYSSCNSTMVNQANESLTYCKSDWAGVTGYVANNCGGAQNAHGGNCVAADQRWFIQIEHS